MNEYMKFACECAHNGISKKEGGPFGAVIADSLGNIISKGNNRVLIDNDPTAHAEIVAIREASKALKNYDLSNLILYTTCEPCPMCLSAIIWSNIKVVYYGMTRKDAEKIGFRDDVIYDYLKDRDDKLITLNQIDKDECKKIFNEYSKTNQETY